MSRATSGLSRFAPSLLLFAGLFAYSAIQAPVPAVNEPQYLGKAKHLWDAGWCPRDFFLDSSNPHLVFYAAVGWLTRFTLLEATAWAARAAGYLLLAVGWTMLVRRLVGSRWAALPSAAVFLLLASLGSLARSDHSSLAALSAFGSLSGEWLVGGIEGKVFAYALLFAAIALRLDGRLTTAAACLGASVSFHPIVGAWGLVCAAAAELATRRRGGANLAGLRAWLLPVSIFTLTALPGLVPAAFTLGGADPTASARATYLQVFVRLRHHLDPTQFPPGRYAGYPLLLAASLALLARIAGASRRPAEEDLARPDDLDTRRSVAWFTAFVLATVAVASAGVAVGWHGDDSWTMPLRNLRGTLLKFYPFRLADLFVPLAFSLAVAASFTGGRGSRRASSEVGAADIGGRHLIQRRTEVHLSNIRPPTSDIRRPIPRLPFLLTLAAYAAALAIPSPDRNPSRMPSAQFADWRDVAGWVREKTPTDALIVSPSRQWGFRWFADRAVYVDYKDAPQDAPGLIEWERRIGVLKRWWESSHGQYSPTDLRRLSELTGGDYLVTGAYEGRFTATPIYANETYRVYALRP